MRTAVLNMMMKTDAIVPDIDQTLIGSRMAESGLSLIKYEWSQGNYRTAVGGFLNGVRVLGGTAIRRKLSGKFEAENWGLGAYHRTLGRYGITRYEVDEVLKAYVHRHEMPGAREFLGE